MKNTHTTLSELSRQYRSVLLKCVLINAMMMAPLAHASEPWHKDTTDGTEVLDSFSIENTTTPGSYIWVGENASLKVNHVSIIGNNITTWGDIESPELHMGLLHAEIYRPETATGGNLTFSGEIKDNTITVAKRDIIRGGNITIGDGSVISGNTVTGVLIGSRVGNPLPKLVIGNNIKLQDNNAPDGLMDVIDATIGDNFTVTGNNPGESIIYAPGSLTIGDNLLMDNPGSKTQITLTDVDINTLNLTIGDNATFKNFFNGIRSQGDVTIGDNLTMSNAQGGYAIRFEAGSGSKTISLNIGKNALFENNYSEDADGSVFYTRATNPSNITFGDGLMVRNNVSEEHGEGKKQGTIYLKANSTANFGSATFMNNTTMSKGAAIDIDSGATVNLNGDAVFENNISKATGSDVKNDIDNNGTLNIYKAITLDGGITGTGVVDFKEGSSLKANLNGSTIITSGEALGKAKLVLDSNANGKSFKITGTTTNDLTFDGNSLYDIILTDSTAGTNTWSVAKKSNEEIVNNLVEEGATAQQAKTIAAVTDSTSDNPVITGIIDAVQEGNVAVAAKGAEELAPTTSRQIMGVTQSLNNVLQSATNRRIAALGRAGGDVFVGGSVWAQGLYNYSKQSAAHGYSGFKANTKGIAFGVDGKMKENLIVGFGYGHTKTNADQRGRDTDMDGHNFFVYGSYQPSAWYVNGMLSYGLNKYTEEKAPMGIKMKEKYDVNTYAANLMTGYNFENGITSEGGLRYVITDPESYNDGVQHVSTKKDDMLTAVMGVKYATTMKNDNWMFTPALRVGAIYDVISDDTKANVNIIGGGNYQVTGQRLHRFGIETGVGLEADYADWNFFLNYGAEFRKDFQSHTGMMKAKYNF